MGTGFAMAAGGHAVAGCVHCIEAPAVVAAVYAVVVGGARTAPGTGAGWQVSPPTAGAATAALAGAAPTFDPA